MQMTVTSTPTQKNAEKVYQALLALGVDEWHGRSAIAKHLGMKQLTPSLVAGLEMLQFQGRIVAEQHNIPDSPIPVRWEYKIAEGGKNTAKK